MPQSVDWCIGTLAFGTDISCGTAIVASTATGVSSGGSAPITNYSSAFSLPNLSLAAGTYFLTLGNGSNTDGSHNDYWGTTGAATSGDALLVPGFTGTSASQLNNETSFQIYGTTSAPSAVPEPSSAVLVGAGFLLFAGSIYGRSFNARSRMAR